VRKATGRREEATPESADADNQAALAQAELPDENVVDDEDLPEPEPVAEVVAERSVEDIVDELISDSEIATIEDALQEESATETIDSELNDGKTNND
jgi:hypothetical protein